MSKLARNLWGFSAAGQGIAGYFNMATSNTYHALADMTTSTSMAMMYDGSASTYFFLGLTNFALALSCACLAYSSHSRTRNQVVDNHDDDNGNDGGGQVNFIGTPPPNLEHLKLGIRPSV